LDPFLRSRHRIRKWLHELLVERWSFRNAAAIQFTAVEEKELAQRSFAGRRLFANSNGVIIPNAVIIPEAVDLEQYQPEIENLLATFPELRDKEIVLFLGRINFKKGLDILAEAFGQISRNRNNAHLLIAGPDNEGYGERVRGWLRAQGVLSRVTFAGMLRGSAKEAAFRLADVFVLPSYTENFGIAVVEAMARKVPVVVSNRVNIWHEIEGAAAGIVVEPESDAVARGVIRVLDDRKLRRQLGENGFELVRREYSWQSVGDKMVALYERAMQRDSANA
jgi:glycosyltransferase involved in cell wall biosynthesis